MKSYLAAFSLLVLALGLTGCGKGGLKAPPKVEVAAVDAAPGYDSLDFVRVKKHEQTLNYTGGVFFSFDADHYDFHFDVTPPGATSYVDVATFNETLVAGRDYFFVAAQAAGQVAPITFDEPAFDTASSDAQVLVVQANEQLGPVDVYLEPSGTDLTTATPLGNLSFMDYTSPATRAPGDYVLTVTAPQDPATILYQSSTTVTVAAGDSDLVVLAAGPGGGLGDIVASVTNAGASTTVIDKNAKTALRVINAAADQADRDIYLDKNFTTAAYPSAAYGVPSAYTTLASGAHDIAVTPAGNVGAIQLEETQTLNGSSYYTYLVTGDSNGLNGLLVPEDHRSAAEGARVQFIDGATQFTTLYFYLLPAGTDITTAYAQSTLVAPSDAAATLFAPGDYELTLVDASTGTTVAGPTAVTLNAGGVYGVLAVNGADTSTAKGIIIDDTP